VATSTRRPRARRWSRRGTPRSRGRAGGARRAVVALAALGIAVSARGRRQERSPLAAVSTEEITVRGGFVSDPAAGASRQRCWCGPSWAAVATARTRRGGADVGRLRVSKGDRVTLLVAYTARDNR
jgi:hypothetical protein